MQVKFNLVWIVIPLILVSIMLFPPQDIYSLDFLPYQIFSTSIDNVKIFDGLEVDTKEKRWFSITKDSKEIISVSKSGKYVNFKLNRGVENNTVFNIESNNPNVLLCNIDGKCSMKITSNEYRINIQYQDLEKITKTMGLYGKDAKQQILDFSLDGNIEDQRFSLHGSVLFDNSNESKEAYQKNIIKETQRWSESMGHNGENKNDENTTTVFTPVNSTYYSLVILIVACIVTYVIYYKKRHNKS